MKTLKVILVMLLISISTLLASNENPTKEEVAKLYVATFNRAPDNGGLLYWINQSGLTLNEIAQSFFDQEETLNLYPNGSSNKSFIESVYNNLFNRSPDIGGLNYWENKLNLGEITRNMFIMAVINGALDNEDGYDATTLENKKEVGVYFADKGLNNYYQAIYAMQGVTSDYSSVSFIKTKIDNSQLTSDVWSNFGNLSSESVEILGRNAAVIIPGCSYTSETSIVFSNVYDVITYRTMINNLVQNEKDTKTLKKRATSVNETNQGSCGGTSTQTGTKNNGDSNLVYTLNNYCTEEGSKRTVLNGVINVYIDGEAIDDGETINGITASTQTGGIVMDTIVNGVTTTETLHLKNFVATVGVQNVVSADEIKVVSQADGTFEISNLDIIVYSNNDTSYMQISNAKYVDPDIGSVTLTTSPIATSGDSTGSATITVTSDNASATFTSNDMSTGIFYLEQNGESIGALDCYSLKVN